VFLHDDILGKNDEMLHISLAKAATMILIAPASANMIAKIANGYADCLLSSVCLATSAPILVAPAMNKIMWENEFVQSNISKLKHIIGPASGKQACGDNGFGRMLEPIEIFQSIKYFGIEESLKNKKILITTGPTVEAIDPVRFISNNSSGKMGYAIAKMATLMGADVTVISGPTALGAPTGAKLVQVKSADQMLEACLKEVNHNHIFISAAAVADYKPTQQSSHKIKKDNLDLSLELSLNPDIVTQVKLKNPGIFTLALAAETQNIKEYGYKKLLKKNIELIAINDVSNGQVFDSHQNELHIICKNGKEYFIEKDCKEIVAKKLLQIIANNINQHEQ
jgi:phosphopantothenoylcysteine decarboxylase/phosphopantothenate--cysteine ligase